MIELQAPVAATLTFQVTKAAGLTFITPGIPATVTPQTRGVATLTLEVRSFDGSFVPWDHVTGKPTEFPPEDHDHEIEDVVGLSDLLTSLQGSIEQLEVDIGNIDPDVSWDDVTGKPTEFPPADHDHEIEDVVGLSDLLTSLQGSITQLTEDIENIDVDVSWDDVTDKPTLFPPTSHMHPINDVTGLEDALDAQSAANILLASQLAAHQTANDVSFASMKKYTARR